jgi:hypothetical protein
VATYFEAPDEYDGAAPAVFLAGGITGCPDWQFEAHRHLADLPIAILNPRREDFPIHDPSAAAGQIEWEYRHLRHASAVLFWFPASGDITQPIALYELGAHATAGKPLAVGCDPSYVRRGDVLHQLALARPDITVRDNLADTCKDVRALLTDVANRPRPSAKR